VNQTVKTQSLHQRWTPEQIRAARMASLVPLLQRRGRQLLELPAGNFELPSYKGLPLKDSYWRWAQHHVPLGVH
jgi:hypothetical protein